MKSRILQQTKALFVLSFMCLTAFAMGSPGGITGYTLKTSTKGCYCHTSSSSSSVSLIINGPASLTTGQQGNYSVVMTHTSTISKGGMNIAASGGTLVNSDSRLKVLNGELTHPSAQTGTTTLTWNFKYTAPSTAGNQTIYATGCGVYSKWNNAPNFTVNVTSQTAINQELKLPSICSLEQNYPNPFNPSTSINYTIPTDSHIKIIIYNAKGEVVNIPVDSYKIAGQYKLIWNAVNQASGIYFYKIEAGKFSQTKKMILLK